MEYDLSYDDSPSLKQTLADLLRGMSKKQAYQELGQGIQNTAKVIPSVVESLGRGAIAQVPGTVGDISQLARQFAPKTMQNVMGNRVAPTTEEILAKVPRLNPNYEGSNQHEMIGGLVSPAMPFLLRAGAKATQNMPIGNMIAYHGTPHEIQGGFDISKVGTGEGAQSYGHGMYFAENPIVAEGYKEALSIFKTTLDGVPITSDNPKFSAVMTIGSQGYKKALEQAELAKKSGFVKPEIANQEIANIKALKNSKIESVKQGNLYKVDIPDKDIPNMLDWDKPISQQSNSVQNVAKELLVKIKKISPDADLSNMNGQQLYRLYQQYRGNNPDFASEGMNELGIKGIRYLDEGSRNVPKYSGDIAYIHAGNDFKKHNYTLDDALSGMKQAYKNANVKELKDALNEVYGIKPKQTSNFVVFDPKEVKILEKNNKSIEPTITVNDRNIPVTLHPVEERQGHKIEFVNTNKFENAFKKDETGYIGPLGTENAIKNRYKGVEEFLKTAPSMRASEAYVKPNGSVVFGDGRHRFAYLRDQGLDKIPISMDKESIKNAKKYGYID